VSNRDYDEARLALCSAIHLLTALDTFIDDKVGDANLSTELSFMIDGIKIVLDKADERFSVFDKPSPADGPSGEIIDFFEALKAKLGETMRPDGGAEAK
jgi:hypothetical protein